MLALYWLWLELSCVAAFLFDFTHTTSMNVIYKLLKLGVWVENYCYYEMLSVWVIVAGAVMYWCIHIWFHSHLTQTRFECFPQVNSFHNFLSGHRQQVTSLNCHLQDMSLYFSRSSSGLECYCTYIYADIFSNSSYISVWDVLN